MFLLKNFKILKFFGFKQYFKIIGTRISLYYARGEFGGHVKSVRVARGAALPECTRVFSKLLKCIYDSIYAKLKAIMFTRKL